MPPSPHQPGEPGPSAASTAKLAVRDQLLAARRRSGPAAGVEQAAAIRDHALAWEEVRRAATVALYVSVGNEPGTGLLLEALAEAGKRVLLPLLMADNDLDWAPYAGPDSLATASRGLLEPTTRPLGPEAVATADVVLVPGLAVSAEGMRLGRGGGSYDRALARVPLGTPVAVVLGPDEVGVEVPHEEHDRPVTHALTSAGVRRLG